MANSFLNSGLSGENTGKKILLSLLAAYTLILFVITGLTQFSCYPMITGGNIFKFCRTQERKLEIIKDPRTHGNTLLTLAKTESDESVLGALTNSLDRPRVANNHKELQRQLAYNPKTPIDVLNAFVKSEDLGILEQIAKRENATPELLEEVANNPYFLEVANNFSAKKLNEQKALEYEKALGIQINLINNPKITEDVLLKFAKSKNIKVLGSIANLSEAPPNEKKPRILKAPASVIREIANNPVFNDPIVQADFQKTLDKINILLTQNSHTPDDVLDKLASSKNYVVLTGVVNNPNTSTSAIEMIGENSITWGDDGLAIQKALASRDKVPREVWEKLANNSEYGEVLLALSGNDALPSDLKNFVAEKLINNVNNFNSEPELPQQPDISEELFSENNKPNCTGKHIRNNLIGGAAGSLAFFLSFGNPLAAGAVYTVVTGIAEIATRC
jgi:hypothetical protein